MSFRSITCLGFNRPPLQSKILLDCYSRIQRFLKHQEVRPHKTKRGPRSHARAVMLVYLAMGQLLSSPASANHDRTRTRIATRTRTGTITSTIATTRNGMRTETMTSTLRTRINLRTGTRAGMRTGTITWPKMQLERGGMSTGTRQDYDRNSWNSWVWETPLAFVLASQGIHPYVWDEHDAAHGFDHRIPMWIRGENAKMSAFQSFPLRKEPRVFIGFY